MNNTKERKTLTNIQEGRGNDGSCQRPGSARKWLQIEPISTREKLRKETCIDELEYI